MKVLKLLTLMVFLAVGMTAEAAKKVLILYSTGGHSTAARSIEQMLNQNPGEFEVIRHDFAENLTGFARWFYFGGYDLISQKANWINKLGVSYKWQEAELRSLYASQRYNATFNQPENILAYIESVKPDVIISTHFSVADTLAMLREEGHLKTTPIAWTHLDMVDKTFFRQIGDQLDMSFLPTEKMEQSWSQVVDPAKLSSTGIPIMSELLEPRASVAPGPERDSLKLSLGLETGRPAILLMGGSMGALSYDAIISEISETLRLSEKPNVQFIAICGRNKAKADQLRAWAASQRFPGNASLLVTEFIDQSKIKQLQNVSDLIISKPGGLTTFELLTTGKPVIMTEGIGLQEKHNATYVAQEGAALYLPKPAGIGNAAYNLLLGDPSLSANLVKRQTALRENFQLDKIIEWVRTAKVLQPERPETTVLERQRQMKNQPVRPAVVMGGRCSALFRP